MKEIRFDRTILGVMMVCAASLDSACAAEISNTDSTQQTIVVTEGTSRREVVLTAGETLDFCPDGCFVTFPNGDREALTGDETLTIAGGKASLK